MNVERYYRIANLTFRIAGEEAWMPGSDGILEQFRVVPQPWEFNVALSMRDELDSMEGEPVFSGENKLVYRDKDTQIRYEGVPNGELTNAYLRMARSGTSSQVQIKQRPLSDKMILTALELEHRLTEAGAILFHSAYIRTEEGAILFTAPSGTGKSTQAELWRRHRGAEQINGDRSAVRVEKNGIFVYGVPYSGSSRICRNETCSLRAIVYLSQAKDSTAIRLRGVRAFRAIWEGCCVNTWNPEDMACCAETVTALAERIPVIALACRPDETAVEALEHILNEGR